MRTTVDEETVKVRIGGGVGSAGIAVVPILNISAGGMLLESPYAMEIDCDYWSLFKFEESDAFNAKLKATRCAPGTNAEGDKIFLVGCSFSRLAETQRIVLSEWILERQMILRQLRSGQ